MFEGYLQLHMRDLGYEGVYANKKSEQPFGNAVFYRADRFTLESASVLDLTQAWRSVPGVDGMVAADAAWVTPAENATTVAQVVMLRDGDRPLVVVNTHLFSNPFGLNIRILQAAAIVHHLQQHAAGRPVIICGDFNTEPHRSKI